MAALGRARQRQKLVAAILFLVFVLLLFHHTLLPSAGQYNTPLRNSAPQNAATGDDEVEMVVASMKRENLTWLDDYLLDWKKNIYVVDDPTAPLTVEVNKGREAMVFLT
jgi:hypothetical protein